jgi:hypothetical protein
MILAITKVICSSAILIALLHCLYTCYLKEYFAKKKLDREWEEIQKNRKKS